VKKKAYRLACKLAAKDGRINNAAGQWVNRSSGIPDSSMKRDYSPQGR
jgi:Tfp pilus assembly protein PilF